MCGEYKHKFNRIVHCNMRLEGKIFTMPCTVCRFGNPFRQAVSAREAPDYYDIVLQPMDLGAVKRRLEGGVTGTPAAFLRDCLLVFANAMMFNSADHDIYKYAMQMRQEVKALVRFLRFLVH